MGNSENEQTWKDFFLSLRKRGLKGVHMVVSDDHKGLVNAAKMCFQESQRQRCQFHFGRNARKHLPRRMYSELHRRLRSIWDAPDRETTDLLLQKLWIIMVIMRASVTGLRRISKTVLQCSIFRLSTEEG